MRQRPPPPEPKNVVRLAGSSFRPLPWPLERPNASRGHAKCGPGAHWKKRSHRFYFGLMDLRLAIAAKFHPIPSCSSTIFKASPSVVRQADCILLSLARPRLTFSKISQAFAAQTKGLGAALWAARCASMTVMSSWTLRKTPRRMLLTVNPGKRCPFGKRVEA